MAKQLTAAQIQLLRAVAAGHVCWRLYVACGWDIRRTDQRSRGRGGDLGRCVTHALNRLASKGLVALPDRQNNLPVTLTELGKFALDSADSDRTAREIAWSSPTLPQAADNREPFPAGTDGDAPDGATLEFLEEDGSERAGWWQRQGDRWVPVANQKETSPTDSAQSWLGYR